MTEIGSMSYENLLVTSNLPIVSEKVTVAEGEDLDRGALVARELLAVGDIENPAENTGDAEIASATLAAGAMKGVYKIVCTEAPTEADADDAVFAVYAPDGSRLKDATQDVEYDGGHLVFTIPGVGGGGTDSIVDDEYTIEVDEGSKEVVEIDKDGVDGSQIPFGILADDVDASSDDEPGVVYLTGEFNEGSVVVPSGDDIENYRDALRKIGIYLKPAVAE